MSSSLIHHSGDDCIQILGLLLKVKMTHRRPLEALFYTIKRRFVSETPHPVSTLGSVKAFIKNSFPQIQTFLNMLIQMLIWNKMWWTWLKKVCTCSNKIKSLVWFNYDGCGNILYWFGIVWNLSWLVSCTNYTR